jgi:hypothetical protein
MIRKLVKRLGVFLAVLVGIPLLLMILGAIFLPKKQIKQRLEAQLADATGAVVVLAEPSLTLFPGLGVSIGGGSITGTGADLARVTGQENELQDYRLDLADFQVQMALRPLLNKELEVVRVLVRADSLQMAWQGGRLLARDCRIEVTDLSVPLVEGAGPGSLPAGAAPGEMIPENLALRFQGRIAGLELDRATLSEVEFTGDLDTRLLTVESLSARQDTGLLTGAGEIDYERDPHGELDFEMRAEAVPAASLLAPFASDIAERLDCHLDGQVSGTCNLEDQDSVRESLSLVGELASGQGLLAAGDWLQEVTPYLGDRTDLVNVRFGSLEHQFRVDEGRYLLDGLVIDGEETDWRGDGWVSLDGRMDTRFQVKLPPGFTPDLGQWRFLAETLRDEDGRVNLGFRLHGDSSKPRVALDLGSMGADGNSGLKKGLGGLLDKWKTR